jgi:hypothetical protein
MFCPEVYFDNEELLMAASNKLLIDVPNVII